MVRAMEEVSIQTRPKKPYKNTATAYYEFEEWFKTFEKQERKRVLEAEDRLKRYLQLATYPQHPQFDEYEDSESARAKALISRVFWKGYIYAKKESLGVLAH